MTALHWIKRERMAHKKAMRNPLSTDSERAIEYARWLAQRDGIELPPTEGLVQWAIVEKQKRAFAVRFRDVIIKLPHYSYIERGAVQLPDAEANA